MRAGRIITGALSFIAGLAAVVLVALFVGPGFVDWNQFRPRIESELSALFGRKIEIRGDISFKVLPAPALDVAQVALANDPRAKGGPLLTLDSFEARVALAPLLSGDIHFTHLRLIRPHLTLENFENGGDNWRFLRASLLQDRPLAGLLRNVRLDSVSIEKGALRYLDHQRKWVVALSNLDARIEADSLLGPFRAEGALTHRRQAYKAQMTLARFAEGRAVPLELQLRRARQPVKATFSGLLTEATPQRGIDGTLIVQADSLAALFPANPVFAESSQKLRLEAGVALNQRRASLRKMRAVLGAMEIEGSGEVIFEAGREEASLALKSNRIDAGSLFPGQASGALALTGGLNELIAQTSEISRNLPRTMPVKAKLDIDGLIYGGEFLRKVTADIAASEGRITRLAVAVQLPGAAALSFEADSGVAASGVAAPVPETPGGQDISGRISLSTRNLRPLAVWLAGGKTHPLAARLQKISSGLQGKFSLDSALSIKPGDISLTGLEAALGGLSLSGDLRYRTDLPRPRLSADLSMTRLEWDFYAPLAEDLLADSDQSGEDEIAGIDFDLKFEARQVIWQDNLFRDVSAAMRGEQGVIRFERIAGDFEGISLTATGRADLSGKTPAIDMSAKLAARAASSLAKLAGFSFPAPRMRALGSADLNLALLMGGELRRDARLTLTGKVGGSPVSLKGTLSPWRDGVKAWLSAEASASNPDAARLARQIGAPPALAGTGKGTATIALDGPVSSTLDAAVKLALGPFSYDFNGKISQTDGRAKSASGKLAMTGNNLHRLIKAAGFASRAAPARRAEPFKLAAQIAWQPGAWRWSGLDLKAAGALLKGKGSYERDGKKGFVEASLSADILPLDLIWPQTPAKDTGGWSAAPLPLDRLNDLNGHIDLTARRARFGALRLSDVGMRLALPGNGLAVDNFRARLAGGQIRGAFKLIEPARKINARMSADFALTGADIARLSGMLNSQKTASGLLDLTGSFSAQGRSMLGLVSSLGGKGQLTARRGAFYGFDLAVLDDALGKITAVSQLEKLLAHSFAGGKTDFTRIQGQFSIEDGIFKLARAKIEATASGRLNAFFDLPRAAIDSEMRFTLPRAGDLPDVGLLIAGPVAKATLRRDTAELEQAFAIQVIEKGIENLSTEGTLPVELLDLLGIEQEEASPPPVTAPPAPKPQKKALQEASVPAR